MDLQQCPPMKARTQVQYSNPISGKTRSQYQAQVDLEMEYGDINTTEADIEVNGLDVLQRWWSVVCVNVPLMNDTENIALESTFEIDFKSVI
ncbi:UNVERIFIED_CONTAM: hypothetical protein K2H54_056802 [Gekko kuhli]